MLNTKFAKNMMENEEGMNHLLVNVQPEESKEKVTKPVAFMLILDASYSMNDVVSKPSHTVYTAPQPDYFVNPNQVFNQIRQPLKNIPVEWSNKLDYVKQASERLIDMMKDGDKLGVVSFANIASLDYPLTTLDQKERNNLKDRIRALSVRGATNISDALELAFNQITDEIKENYHVKLILLSDGEANHGITDVEGISNLASKFRKQDVSISTIGVGVDYNSFFMENISTASGGAFAHLEQMEQLNEIFTKELENLTSLTTKQAKLIIKAPKGIHIASNLNGFSEDKPGEIFIGNLFNEQNILIELYTEEKIKTGDKTISIRFEYINSEGTKQAVEKEVILKIVTEEEMVNLETDKEVVELVKQLMEAKTKKEAVRHYEVGDFHSLKGDLTTSYDKFSKLGEAYNFEVSNTIEELSTLENSMMTRSLNKASTKSLYSQSYSVMRNDKNNK